jgi:hypothetical protein
VPSYEFECLDCHGVTCFLLKDGDDLPIGSVHCEWCGLRRIQLLQYFRNCDELIASLHVQISQLEHRIKLLENPNDGDEDLDTADNQ